MTHHTAISCLLAIELSPALQEIYSSGLTQLLFQYAGPLCALVLGVIIFYNLRSEERRKSKRKTQESKKKQDS